jgi:hypothetical protein
MYLCHGAVDPPMSAEGAPAADELLFGFCDFHRTKFCINIEISKNIENII